LFGVWKANYTYPERYDKEGVTDRVLEYLSNGKKELTVVDVGCSIAVALKTMKARLEEMDVKVKTIGMISQLRSRSRPKRILTFS
jgi:hypothetical protein